MNRHLKEQDLPALEINPNEEYHERPAWQRILAMILIVLVVAATVICAVWPMLGL